MEQPKARPPWTAKRIAFLALTWVAVLLLMEAAIRIAQPDAGLPIYSGYPAGLVIPDPILGHSFQPNFRGFFPSLRYRDIPVDTNSLGFRDVEWTAVPDPSRPRVMVLGDSITFGSPLRVEERFTERAAAILQSRGISVEICNCGVTGFNLDQYNKLLQHFGRTMQPRVVLIGYCLNDAEPLNFYDNKIMKISDGVRQDFNFSKLRKIAGDYRMDFDQSYAVNFAARAIRQWLWSSPAYAQKMADRYTAATEEDLKDLYSDSAALTRLRKNFFEMKTFAQGALGAELAVVIFVYHHQLIKKDSALNRRVGSMLQELKIPYVDLYEPFLAQAATPDLYAYQDDCHPGVPGHQIAGQAAAALLEQVLAAPP